MTVVRRNNEVWADVEAHPPRSLRIPHATLPLSHHPSRSSDQVRRSVLIRQKTNEIAWASRLIVLTLHEVPSSAVSQGCRKAFFSSSTTAKIEISLAPVISCFGGRVTDLTLSDGGGQITAPKLLEQGGDT